MITKVYCPQCKHYNYYEEFVNEGMIMSVTECRKNRKEIKKADQNCGIIECDYWESR